MRKYKRAHTQHRNKMGAIMAENYKLQEDNKILRYALKVDFEIFSSIWKYLKFRREKKHLIEWINRIHG